MLEIVKKVFFKTLLRCCFIFKCSETSIEPLTTLKMVSASSLFVPLEYRHMDAYLSSLQDPEHAYHLPRYILLDLI